MLYSNLQPISKVQPCVMHFLYADDVMILLSALPITAIIMKNISMTSLKKLDRALISVNQCFFLPVEVHQIERKFRQFWV